MYFQHSPDIWSEFPELAAGAIHVDGIVPDATVEEQAEVYTSIASTRLERGPESTLPEIQAWRRTFTKMGLKPTQYRCASEALLRRYRRDGDLPRLHPLIDLCNAASLAFAVPIAVFDLAQVTDWIEVRFASGEERYLTFGGETESPAAGEVIFADAASQAHARRWTNRQSGLSAVRGSTSSVLVVAEAMHDGAVSDLERLVTSLAADVSAIWRTTPKVAILNPEAPRFTL